MLAERDASFGGAKGLPHESGGEKSRQAVSGLPPRLRYLDVGLRPTCADAVWIPFHELPDRTNELPPRHERVTICDTGPEAQDAATWLRAAERDAVTVPARVGPPTRGRLWEPNPFLAEILRKLEPGLGLDLACGGGREAAAMTAAGWEVTAVDHLPELPERGATFAHRYLGETAKPIHWVVRNLVRDGMPSGRWDLITLFFFLDRPLLKAASAALNHGGSLVVETFTAEHRRRFGKPRREGLVLQPDELEELLPELQVVRAEEFASDQRMTFRYWARNHTKQAPTHPADEGPFGHS